ncbi:MAG: PaaI family thioesterase [Bacteroidota bacterium]
MTLIDKYRQSNNFGRLIDMDFEIIADGIVEYRITITQAHLATPGAAHGGLISALVDGALGVAALSAVHKLNKVVSTIEFKLNFLAPALLNDRIVAKAKVDQLGNRIIISSCDVICLNRDNKLLAKAMGTFNAYDAAKAGY